MHNGQRSGLSQINRLQSILRAAARLVLQLPGWASVLNLMRVQLHWLSIPQRIQFKLCLVVYRCLHNTAPIYSRDLCVPISSLEGRSHLRSAAAGDLRIPSAKTVTIGRQGFSVAGHAAWNNLSTTLKDYTGCLQNQANKIPGFFQDFQEFFKQFSRICLHKMSTQISSFIL